ncbi:MAG: DUF192 domain-containing protein [Actinomycetota bacterium]
MRRLLLIGIVLATLAPATASERAAAELELKVATTAEKIKAFGTFAGARSGSNVRLRLIHLDTIVTKKVPLHDDGGFIGSFARPETGSCKVVARYRSGEGRVRRELTLPCERPEWGTGQATLVDEDNPGSTTTIDIEIADSDAERQYGLMYRKWLHPEKGMAFMFPGDQQGGFWMANCLIPLSIAFYDSTGEIVSIIDMEPCEPQGSTDCPIYDPGVTYRGTLEVNKGRFDAWGIEVGDTIAIKPNP